MPFASTRIVPNPPALAVFTSAPVAAALGEGALVAVAAGALVAVDAAFVAVAGAVVGLAVGVLSLLLQAAISIAPIVAAAKPPMTNRDGRFQEPSISDPP